MRIHQLDIEEIIYTKKPYRQEMYDSIKRIGLSFCIKVVFQDNKYYCQDGHKRLSAIEDMRNEKIYDKRRKIKVIIVNNGDSRSNDCWRSRNTH